MSPTAAQALLRLGGLCALAGLAACSPTSQPREICGNGLDDDHNGLIDCADPDCAGQDNCPRYDAGFFGTCGKCGTTCTGPQSQCVSTLPAGWLTDTPLPVCVVGRCQALEQAVQVRVELDARTTWGGTSPAPRSLAIRFIKKVAADGSPVTCATIAANNGSRLPAAVTQLEDGNKFVFQGVDTYPVSNAQLGQVVSLPYVNVATGGDYLVYVEFWYGDRDGATKLPTLNRAGWGCIDAASLSPIVASDNCPAPGSDAGTCRIFSLPMPACPGNVIPC